MRGSTLWEMLFKFTCTPHRLLGTNGQSVSTDLPALTLPPAAGATTQATAAGRAGRGPPRGCRGQDSMFLRGRTSTSAAAERAYTVTGEEEPPAGQGGQAAPHAEERP